MSEQRQDSPQQAVSTQRSWKALLVIAALVAVTAGAAALWLAPQVNHVRQAPITDLVLDYTGRVVKLLDRYPQSAPVEALEACRDAPCVGYLAWPGGAPLLSDRITQLTPFMVLPRPYAYQVWYRFPQGDSPRVCILAVTKDGRRPVARHLISSAPSGKPGWREGVFLGDAAHPPARLPAGGWCNGDGTLAPAIDQGVDAPAAGLPELDIPKAPPPQRSGGAAGA